LQAPEENVKPFIEKGKFTKGVCYIYGMIKRMDEGIGKILQCLKDEGLEDNTMIFFTSDNGPQFTSEGDWSIKRFNHNFNGCKGNVYEGGIRVPMVIKWHGMIKKGKIISEMVHFVDWFPTILNICRIKSPESIKFDGQNVLPVIKGEKVEYGKRLWQWNRLIPVRVSNIAMRGGRWKLLRPPIPETMRFPEEFGKANVEYTYNPEKFTDVIRKPFPEFKIEKENPSQLYNIEEDPFERNDLSEKYPEIVEKMERERRSIKE